MKKVRTAGVAGLVSTLSLLVACRELIGDPSFDRWCGDMLCDWQLDAGRIERTETWHARDYAVDFTEKGTQISQLSDRSALDCLRFELIADVDAEAGLSLELDFNDDGTVDHTRAIPGVRWKRLSFDLHAPHHYEKLRFILRKAGEGRAVVAQLRARYGDSCTGPRIELSGQRAGAACTSSAVCESELCIGARCASCREDHECQEGEFCVSGGCSDCREDADCAADERCAWREARSRGAGRSCIPEASELERELLELCDRDADCYGVPCAFDDGEARKCGLPCEAAASCPEDLVCRQAFDLRGAIWVPVDLCLRPAEPGAACGEPSACASGSCCDGLCAANASASCD
jgi:hypothetical protein